MAMEELSKIPVDDNKTKGKRVREVSIDDGDNDNAIANKCVDVRSNNDDEAFGDFDEDANGKVMGYDDIRAAKTNKFKNNKTQV